MAASVSRSVRASHDALPAPRRLATAERPTAGTLVDFALRRFAGEGCSDPPDRLCPLVIVAPRPDVVRCLLPDATAGQPDAAGASLTHWTGPELGRAIGVAFRSDRLGALHSRLAASPRCLIEGIDRIGPPGFQHAFIQLFDAAVESGTAFCLTLATHPMLSDLAPALTSRLCGGLVVHVPTPVCAPGAAPAGPALSLRRLLTAVARHHDLTTGDLVGPSRCRAVAEARSIAMYLARHLTDQSLYAIGHACGGRDHTTVLHGVRVIEERLSRDPAFAADLAHLSRSLAAAPGSSDTRCRQTVDPATGKPHRTRRHSTRRTHRRGSTV